MTDYLMFKSENVGLAAKRNRNKRNASFVKEIYVTIFKQCRLFSSSYHFYFPYFVRMSLF